MTSAKSLTQHYYQLTPQERFRLILAARSRNDESEREQLLQAGQHVTITMPDHGPYAMALGEVSYLTFMELIEDAARYFDAFDHAKQVLSTEIEVSESTTKERRSPEDSDEQVSSEVVSASDDDATSPEWQRYLHLVYALGYILRTKVAGWQLFCERLSVSPFLLWEAFPGFSRLQHALTTVETISFDASGFLHWVNQVRPVGHGEVTMLHFHAEKVAQSNEEDYRQRISYWGA